MNKKILVGIDFSDCSLNALKHAITIAQRASSGITMVWVNHLDYSKEIFSVEPKDLMKEVENKFNALIKKYKSKLGREEFSFQIRKGKIYKEKLRETVGPELKEIYAPLIKFGDKLNEEMKKIPAIEVAKVVAEVFTVKKPKLTYIVGKDAKGAAKVARLPKVLLDWMILKHIQKMA